MSSKTASVTQESHDSVTRTVGCEDTKAECSTSSSWWGGCEDSGLAIAVIALVILWTLACWCGMSWFCGDKDNSRKGGKDCKDDGCSTQYLGVGFVWFIILIIFLVCAYNYKWHAVSGLLVFFLLILLAVMWCGC